MFDGNVAPAALIEAARLARCFVFDLETTGLDPHQDRIEGIAFFVPATKTTGPVRAWYPFVGSTFLVCNESGEIVDGREPLPQRETMEALRPLFKDPSLVAIGHNTKFDCAFLRYASGCVDPIEVENRLADSMIADYLSDERRRRYGLKIRVKQVFGHEMTTYAEAVRGQALLNFLPQKPLGAYAMDDCQWTYELFANAMSALRKQTWPQSAVPRTPTEVQLGRPLGSLEAIYWGIEMKLVRILMEIETTGVLIDWQHLVVVEEKLTARRDELAHRIEDFLGWPCNPRATQQVVDALFAPPPDGIGLPSAGVPVGKEGLPSTSDKVIKHFKRFHPLVQDILELRSIEVVLSGFVRKIRRLAQESFDGRIRTKFNQTGTVIGRLSSSDPFNGQNMPRDKDLVRKSFCAYFEGDQDPELVLLGGDYGQIELRVASHLAKEDNMREVYRMGKHCRSENGSACVRFTFHECHDCGACLPPIERDGKKLCGKCSSENIEHQRRCRHVDLHQRTAEDANVKRNPLAKNLNFGLLYRMAAPKFCIYADLFDSDGKPMIPFAQEVVARWFQAYPAIHVFHELNEQTLPLNDYVAKTITGRRRRLYVEYQKNPYRAVTQAVQFQVSGSSQDLIKIAMTRIFEERNKKIANTMGAERKAWEKFNFLLQVHDEVLFQTSKHIKDESAEIFERCMVTADGGMLSVPLECAVKTGRTWDDVHG